VVGSAAMLAGVTRMTMSLTVIIFELTGAITYGIYERLIQISGYPYLNGSDSFDSDIPVSKIMRRKEGIEVIEAERADLSYIGTAMNKD
jgi:chloride channel 3/4/5